MSVFDGINRISEITDTYEFGWNVTRRVLAEKSTYIEKTVFGDYIVKQDTDLRRSLEAERLYHKYSKWLLRGEKEKYARGALALISEWDIIDGVPDALNENDENEDDDDDEAYEN